jgi:hypothetical protein
MGPVDSDPHPDAADRPTPDSAGADRANPNGSSPDASQLPVLASRGELVVIPDESQPVALVDVVLGLVAVAADTLRTSLGRPGATHSTALDAALEVTWQGWSLTSRTAAALGRAGAPVVRILVDPPLVPTGLRPVTMVRHSAASWRDRRPAAVAAATEVRDIAVPLIVDVGVEPVDLTELVVRRVDLQRVVTAALEDLDLTEIVLDQVDLQRVADAVLDRIDLDAVARDRMDLMGLADYIIDGIDLPGIIRESTGSVASETVRTVRMQSIDADEAVQRVVDRILLWRKGRSVDAPDDVDAKEPST